MALCDKTRGMMWGVATDWGGPEANPWRATQGKGRGAGHSATGLGRFAPVVFSA